MLSDLAKRTVSCFETGASFNSAYDGRGRVVVVAALVDADAGGLGASAARLGDTPTADAARVRPATTMASVREAIRRFIVCIMGPVRSGVNTFGRTSPRFGSRAGPEPSPTRLVSPALRREQHYIVDSTTSRTATRPGRSGRSPCRRECRPTPPARRRPPPTSRDRSRRCW